LKRRWLGRRPGRRFAGRAALYGLAAAFLLVGVIAVYSFLWRRDSTFAVGWATDHCSDSGFACNIVSSLLFTAAPLLVALVVFLTWRYRQVPREYVQRAKDNPAELVETSGSIIQKVVGRDDLCDILQEDLNASGGRRPHVLVGGLGIGKTAVLVQLTKTLAERDAVPVPIRLRDASGDIDFLALAKARFLELVGRRARSAAEGERVWRQLLKDDRVVVLADGLEEAFADEQVEHDRHHRVRVAVHEASKDGFPLVITSRPHEALKALEAAKIHLEPLSESAALGYILESDSEGPRARIATVVETADVTDTPLYLQIARDLHTHGLLEHRRVDPRGADRVTLRMRLMEGWLAALVKGELDDAELPIKPIDREVTVAHMQALACVGLRDDTQQVTFVAWDGEPDPGPASRSDDDEDLRDSRDHLQADLLRWLTRRIEAIVRRANPDAPSIPKPDTQAAAATAVRLGLVQHQPDGVRFPHSIVQAYLGSKAMGAALESRGYLNAALSRSGRELLLALVMYCRAGDRHEQERRERLRPKVLRELLATEPDNDEGKLLDIVAAAIEIDTATKLDGGPEASEGGEPPDPPAALVERWRKLQADDETTQDAKFSAIARLADSGHRLAQQDALDRGDVPRERASDPPAADTSASSTPPPVRPKPRDAYRRLYEICRIENSYRVRLAAAQEIGQGGDDAWAEISDHLVEKSSTSWEEVLTAADRDARGNYDLADETERRFTLQGWLLPMLVATTSDYRDEALKCLAGWMAHVGDQVGELARMPLSIESALAQGFKHAANRRPRDQHENVESRIELERATREMLGSTEFWYSRMTLLHALCLFFMTRTAHSVEAGHDLARADDLDAMLKRWLRRPKPRKDEPDDDGGRGGRQSKPQREVREHRFVTEAAALVRRALERGKSSEFSPEAFIWIDESGIATQVGSRAGEIGVPGRRGLWIPPSAGWIGLDPRAQQLVADVMILLNLAERGGKPEQRERRLKQTNRPELPLCLTSERCGRLRPAQTVGMVDIPRPGDECSRECDFDLCPYPPRGQQPHRVELSEAFCRHQRAILNTHMGAGPKPDWQGASRGELRKFWNEMEDRARA
jgi:hypothetical protein